MLPRLPGVQGKQADAILSLKRRQRGNVDDKSAKRQSPRLPRSASSSALALKAAALSATAASVARSRPTHKTKLPPPPTTRSAAASSTYLPPPSKAMGTLSGVEGVPTKPEIRGHTTSDLRTLAAGRNGCGMAIGNNWNSFDARCRGYNTSDAIRKFPVPIAARDGSSPAHRSGSLGGNGGGGGGRSSDVDSHLGPFAAKRKVGEHFDGGADTNEGPLSKRGCRYLSRYCSNLNGLGGNGFQGHSASGVGGRSDGGGGDAQAVGEGASRQLPGLVKTRLQQLPCAPLAVRAPHVVAGLGHHDRTSFAFGYDHGRVAGRAPGTPPSSRRSIFYAVFSLDGLAWREQPIMPCPAPTTFVEPPAARVHPGSGLQPGMAMAAAAAVAAARSPRTGRILPGAHSKLGFSTGPDLFSASERVGNTAPVVGRGACMDTSFERGSGGGGELRSWVGGDMICSFDSAEVFGSFCAVEGDVSLDRLDECFMRERVSSPPGQEGLTEHGNGGTAFNVGLCHYY